MTAAGPVAVTAGTPAGEQVGRNTLPPQVNGSDPSLDAFAKLSAEHRSRVILSPLEVEFGLERVRIYREAPANFAFNAAEAEVEPRALRSLLMTAIVEEDRARVTAIMELNPDDPAGVTLNYIIAFVEALATLYGGRPLAG